MFLNWNRLFTLALLLLVTSTNRSDAAPIVAGSSTQPYINVQQIRLFPGTPFNPGTEPVDFELRASGLLTASWEQQVGNTMAHAVPFVDFSGIFPGDIPFRIFAGTPDLPPTTGEFSNVVQNPLDAGYATGAPSSFVSADYRNTAYFKQVLPDGTTIYSDLVNPAVFTGTLTSLPYHVDQQFVSTGPLNLYLQLGNTINQNTDLLIGQSLHRLVQVVPEPASWSLLSLTALCALRRVKRSSRTRERKHSACPRKVESLGAP